MLCFCFFRAFAPIFRFKMINIWPHLKFFFRCGRPHFLAQKTSDFEIYGVSERTRELSQCGQRVGGPIFRDFVWTSP